MAFFMLPALSEENCPEPLRVLNKAASGDFVYRLIEGKRPIKKCFKVGEMPPAKELEHIFIQEMGISEARFRPYSLSCAPDISHPEQRQSLLFTQHQYYRERLNRGAIQSLVALQKIDSVLKDIPSSMDSVSCSGRISSKAEKFCRKNKMCPKKDHREAMIDLTQMALKKRLELQNSLKEIDMFYKREGGRIQDVQDLEEILDNLKGSISEINSTIPWIEGRLFGKNIEKIERGIRTGQDSDSIRKLIATSLEAQFRANKKELLRRYDQFDEAAKCLDGKGKCDRFSEIISKAPSAFSDSAMGLTKAAKRGYEQFGVVQCLEEEIGASDTYSDIFLSVGEVGLGFMLGGVGGAYGLLNNVFGMTKRGHRVKGAFSLLGLGAWGSASYRHMEIVKKQCRQVTSNMVGMENGDSSVACVSDSYPQNISRYLSCFTEIALAGAIVIPPFVGRNIRAGSSGGTNVTKGFHGSNRFKKVEDIKNSDDLKEFRSLAKNEQATKFNHLLNGFNAEEIKIIRPFAKAVKGKEGEFLLLYRALRYSRVLPRKKRKEFIKHLNEVLKGSKNLYRSLRHSRTLPRSERKEFIKRLDEDLKGNKYASNQYVRRFLKIEKRHTERVTKLEKRYKEKGTFSWTDEKVALELAKRKSHHIEDVLLSCRSRSMNSSHMRGMKLFRDMSFALTGASALAGFSYSNWHLPKDEEWFARLGYETVYVLMYTKALVMVMKNPSSSWLKRYGQYYLGSTIVEGIDVFLYSQFFNISEGDARDALSRIKNSPEQVAALRELSKYLDDSEFVERFKQSLAVKMKEVSGVLEKDSGHDEEGLPEEFGDISAVDWDDPEVQNKLLEAVMLQYYDSTKGYLSLGSKEADRFAFNQVWGVAISVPRDIALALPFYYSLCLTSAWPVGGVMAALGIQTVNQFLGNGLYYYSREGMINQ